MNSIGRDRKNMTFTAFALRVPYVFQRSPFSVWKQGRVFIDLSKQRLIFYQVLFTHQNVISIGNHMISSAIWDKSARVNFSKANQIARARRASAICGLWKIYECWFIPNCTREIMWLLVNNIHAKFPLFPLIDSKSNTTCHLLNRGTDCCTG